jgi:hypothetical protein
MVWAHLRMSSAAPLALVACSALMLLGPGSAIDERWTPGEAVAAAPGPGSYCWDKTPNIAISTRPDDSRIRLVHEGVAFWNRQLSEIGTPFRLGPVAETNQLVSGDYLERMSETVVGAGGVLPDDPAELRHVPGDPIVALSVSPLTSFSTIPRPGRRVLVGIGNRRAELRGDAIERADEQSVRLERREELRRRQATVASSSLTVSSGDGSRRRAVRRSFMVSSQRSSD